MSERLICPKCGRRTVILAFRPHDEDQYYCTWHKLKRDACDWSAFASLDSNSTDEDRQQLGALDVVNPGALD